MADLLRLSQCPAERSGVKPCDDMCNNEDGVFGKGYLHGDCGRLHLYLPNQDAPYVDCYCAGCNGCPVTGAWEWNDVVKIGVLIFHLFVILWYCRSRCRYVFHHLCQAAKSFRLWSEEGATGMQIDALAMERHAARRARALVKMCNLLVVLIFLMGAEQLSRAFLGGRWLLAEQDFLVSLMGITAGALSMWPRALTRVQVTIVGSLLILLSSLLVWISDVCVPDQAHTLPMFLLITIRLPISLLVLDVSASIPCNTVFSVATVYAWTTAGECVLVQGRLLHELVQLIAIVSLSAAFTSFFQEAALNKIDSEKSRAELTAAESLLDLMGDAVVELDKHLRITKDADKLSTLLLSGGTGRSMKGKELAQYLFSSEDRDCFEEAIARSSSGEACSGRIAQAFHVALRGAHDTKIHMECFHVRFNSMDRVCHLVGLKEFSTAPADPLLHVGTSGDSAGDVFPDASGSSDSDASTQVDSAGVALWFDVSTSQLDIVAHTLGLKYSIGISRGRQLMSWVHPDQREDFVDWAQVSLQEVFLWRTAGAVANAGSLCLRAFPQRLCLMPEHLRRAGMVVTSDVSAGTDLVPTPDDDPQESNGRILHLLLQNLQFLRADSWRRNRSRRGSGSSGTPRLRQREGHPAANAVGSRVAL